MNSEKNVEIWTSILDNCANQRIQAGQNPDESLLVVKNTNVETDQTVFKGEKAMQLKEDLHAKQLEAEFRSEHHESSLNVSP